MWGSIVHGENEATVSGIAYLMISALGAGQFVNLSNSGSLVRFIANISPIRYSVERLFRRVVSKTAFEHLLLQFFGFTLGD